MNTQTTVNTLTLLKKIKTHFRWFSPIGALVTATEFYTCRQLVQVCPTSDHSMTKSARFKLNKKLGTK